MTPPLDVKVSVFARDGAPQDLQVVRLEGTERIGQLFEFIIDVVAAPGEKVSADVRAGAKTSVRFTAGGLDKRAVHGMLRSVELVLDGSGGRPTYRLTVVPRAWRATLVTTQQIFMDLSVPDAVEKKLSLVGLKEGAVGLNLLASYPTREFIVQYRENDVQFISRLAEHVGVSFYFDHRDGSDRIVFTDHQGGFMTDEATRTIVLTDRQDEPERVTQLVRNESMIPRVCVLYDYNYRTPDTDLRSTRKLEEGHGGGTLEYAAHFKTNEEGNALASIRAEEMLTQRETYVGASSIVQLSAGLCTTLEESNNLPEQALLITAVTHRLESPLGEAGSAPVYSNTFEAVDGTRTYRPPRVTPKARIDGFVTAIVQGSAATEDYAEIDEFGRYTIQFHFDTSIGQVKAKASRPVRMAQAFAGTSEGMHFPLKPGVEVAVCFADGDPDRPIIVGALPNHTKPAVVTAANSTTNKILTNDGINIEFGRMG